LTVGLLILLVANFVLLRASLRPLERLTQLMRSIDLLRPGSRLEVRGASELQTVQATFNEMLDRLERERRASSTRSVAREESERRRLAAELHDQVGQGLTAVLLQLRSAITDAPEPLRPRLLDVQSLARANLDEIRRIARRLRPSTLDDLGLPSALLSLADAAEDGGAPPVTRLVADDVPPLGEETELVLYRIAQEAITNAVRHAGASRIELTLETNGETVSLAVRDDGRGMIHAPSVERGGMRGMRERAVAIGADLALETSPGHGTSVRVRVRVPA
jgi:two-component system sensor histidine kinase UhpB